MSETQNLYVRLAIEKYSPDERFVEVEDADGKSVRVPWVIKNGYRVLGPFVLADQGHKKRERPMRALDLFCGAGGASMGLHRAGFSVVGVDIEPQPNYPLEFHRVNALAMEYNGIDFVWASPPCQHSTAYKRRPGHVKACANLIPAIRKKLKAWGGPYVIENVVGAREHLHNPIQLCGSSFGLDVRRHRLFECSFPVDPPPCDHSWQTPRFPPATNRTNLRSTVEVGVWRIPLETQQKAMGIDWMTLKELSQAIPPAYSEFLGRAALEPGWCAACGHPYSDHFPNGLTDDFGDVHFCWQSERLDRSISCGCSGFEAGAGHFLTGGSP